MICVSCTNKLRERDRTHPLPTYFIVSLSDRAQMMRKVFRQPHVAAIHSSHLFVILSSITAAPKKPKQKINLPNSHARTHHCSHYELAHVASFIDI